MKWFCCTTWSAQLLPPFDGPLLLDTVGFERSLLAAVLAELHECRPTLPTLALVAPDDLAAQRLCLVCSAVYAVAAATIPLADLRLWFRSVGLARSERLAVVQPACLGLLPASLPGDALMEPSNLLSSPRRPLTLRIGMFCSAPHAPVAHELLQCC